VAGWDWFSLRLDDGSELMVYRLRRDNGSADPHSSGTVIRADGSTRRLAADEVVLEPTGWWTSPATGGRYPSGWRLAVPSEQLDLRVAPLVPPPSSTAAPAWSAGRPVGVRAHRGEGCVELTGYAGAFRDSPTCTLWVGILPPGVPACPRHVPVVFK
jgi:predicted secreted hydrolase